MNSGERELESEHPQFTLVYFRVKQQFTKLAKVKAAPDFVSSSSPMARASATRPAPELGADERAEVKKVVRVLLVRPNQLLLLNWRQKSSARSQLKLTIEEVLDTLSLAYDSPLRSRLRELPRMRRGLV